MLKTLEKLLYAGIGAMAITEEKARQIVAELEKKGHLTGDEASKLVKNLVEKGKRQSGEFQNTISAEVKKALDKLHIVKKEDFEALRKEVRELNAKIDRLLSRHKE